MKITDNKKVCIILYLIIGIFFVLSCLFIFEKYYTEREYQKALKEFNEKQSNLNHSIGILSIATGRYNVFWKEFYESSEKYFFPGQNKHYFLFTDDLNIPYNDASNVSIVKTLHKKWPYPALLRYDFFLSQKEQLKKFDYLFYFNMDLVFKDFVGEEVLPDEKNDGLVFVQHCDFFRSSPKVFPYERNVMSAAYVPRGKEGKYYVPGGINGGMTEKFIAFCEYCSKNTHKDLEKRIIPCWHDEGYTNKYIIGKNPLILPLNYMYPPKCDVEVDGIIKARLRDKQKYGGRYYLRGVSDEKSTVFTRFKYKFLSIFALKKEVREENLEMYEDLVY